MMRNTVEKRLFRFNLTCLKVIQVKPFAKCCIQHIDLSGSSQKVIRIFYAVEISHYACPDLININPLFWNNSLNAEIKGIYKLIVERGHTGKLSYFYEYCKKIVKNNNIDHHTNANILGVKRKNGYSKVTRYRKATGRLELK